MADGTGLHVRGGVGAGQPRSDTPLRPYVARYAGKNLLSGQFVAMFGSADRYLARIAAMNGDTRWAEHHFGVALDMDRRMGSVVHLTETLTRHALFAATRGRTEEARRLAGSPQDRRADRPDRILDLGEFVAD